MNVQKRYFQEISLMEKFRETWHQLTTVITMLPYLFQVVLGIAYGSPILILRVCKGKIDSVRKKCVIVCERV